MRRKIFCMHLKQRTKMTYVAGTPHGYTDGSHTHQLHQGGTHETLNRRTTIRSRRTQTSSGTAQCKNKGYDERRIRSLPKATSQRPDRRGRARVRSNCWRHCETAGRPKTIGAASADLARSMRISSVNRAFNSTNCPTNWVACASDIRHPLHSASSSRLHYFRRGWSLNIWKDPDAGLDLFEIVDQRLDSLNTWVVPVTEGNFSWERFRDTALACDPLPPSRTGFAQISLQIVDDWFHRCILIPYLGTVQARLWDTRSCIL